MRPSCSFRVIGLALALTPAAMAQTVAFTFDDGPKLEATPRLNPAQRNAALLAALKQHQVQAALFVTLGNGADRPEGLVLARAWGEAGHLIGNHTVTHLDLDAAATTLASYEGEIQACDRVIRTLPGYRPWFRFTFLREGNTPEKRDGLRTFLQATGYRNAYVSLDTSDWRLDEAMRKHLARHPDADLAPFRTAYLAHLRQRSEAYRDLSRKLFGRDIPQVMLLHHNLINALFLGDALQQFKAMGWTFMSPETAFQDFIYTLTPQRPAPGPRPEPAALGRPQPGLPARGLGAAGGRWRSRHPGPGEAGRAARRALIVRRLAPAFGTYTVSMPLGL